MKTLTPFLVLVTALLALPAPTQTFIRVKPAPRQTEAQARLAEYDRRLAAATDGLLARIARDRAARPDVYRTLAHYYLETVEGTVGSMRGLRSPTLRTEDLRPDLILPWCWIYLSPYPLGA